MIHTPNITMSDSRCFDCGRYYFTETGCQSQCPYCSQEKLEKNWKERIKLEHIISGLRGALKRAKAKR
jgi:hypothetical protein